LPILPIDILNQDRFGSGTTTICRQNDIDSIQIDIFHF